MRTFFFPFFYRLVEYLQWKFCNNICCCLILYVQTFLYVYICLYELVSIGCDRFVCTWIEKLIDLIIDCLRCCRLIFLRVYWMKDEEVFGIIVLFIRKNMYKYAKGIFQSWSSTICSLHSMRNVFSYVSLKEIRNVVYLRKKHAPKIRSFLRTISPVSLGNV